VADRGAMTTTLDVGAASAAATGQPSPFRAAFRDISSVSAGVVAFGVMLGITVLTTGTGPLAGVLGAVLVYGGSAQLTTVTALYLGSGFVAAVASGAIVNARVLLYGAALEPLFRGHPLWFRLLGAQFIQDQTYLSAIGRTTYRPDQFRRYWGWLGGLLLVVWTASVGAGLLVGPLLPPLPHLVLVGSALFLAMLVPRLVHRAAVTGAAAAGGAALVVTQVMPELGILGGTAAGVGASLLVGRRVR